MREHCANELLPLHTLSDRERNRDAKLWNELKTMLATKITRTDNKNKLLHIIITIIIIIITTTTIIIIIIIIVIIIIIMIIFVTYHESRVGVQIIQNHR